MKKTKRVEWEPCGHGALATVGRFGCSVWMAGICYYEWEISTNKWCIGSRNHYLSLHGAKTACTRVARKLSDREGTDGD